MFVSKAGAYRNYIRIDIRIGWKSLPGTNTLAYWDHLLVMKKKICELAFWVWSNVSE
jgi:hypothetical protein